MQGARRCGVLPAPTVLVPRYCNGFSRQTRMLLRPTVPTQRCEAVDNNAQAVATSRPWLPLVAPYIWQGTEHDGMSGAIPLPPTWKLLLLSDGSVTRHLQLLTNFPVEVECLEMINIGNDLQNLPEQAKLIQGPRVQRQVLLRPQGSLGPALVYATSWWDSAQVNTYLTDVRKPIWVNLASGHIELFRDIQAIYCAADKDGTLTRHFGCEGPFWGRHYLFWHKGCPLTLIYEVFSPRLAEYLGPIQLLAH